MEKFSPWITLQSVPGVGNLLFRRLIDRFGSPDTVLHSEPEALCGVEGISPAVARRILSHKPPERLRRLTRRTLEQGYGIIRLTDPEYPPLLREIPDPPPLLYVNGRLLPSAGNIAVVGSRNATRYGIENTLELARQLAENRLTVVSGMARGIDTAAHEGALMGNGRTVAVLGSGLNVIYPRENRRLYHRIAESGAVISELPLDTEPDGHHFPARNRIISGMSYGAVIVEATLRSGSLITARLAVEQNRDVFAVPGSIRSFKSTGTHYLLKQGAMLVENVQDILDELPLNRRPEPPPDGSAGTNAARAAEGLSREAASVYAALEPYPVHIDDLSRRLDMQPGRLSCILLELELLGLVDQTPGKFFSKSEVEV